MPGDLVDLAASVMDWRHIRQVPVEDEEDRPVGLITHRDLLRLLSRRTQSQNTNFFTQSLPWVEFSNCTSMKRITSCFVWASFYVQFY